MQRSFDRDAIHDAMFRLALTCEPDEQYDPTDDPRPEAAVMALMDLLGNVNARDAAEGIQAALWDLYARWTIGS